MGQRFRIELREFRAYEGERGGCVEFRLWDVGENMFILCPASCLEAWYEFVRESE